MIDTKLSIKKWQLTIRDFFCAILSYFTIAFRTDNNAIVCFSSPLFYRYAGDCMPCNAFYWNNGLDRLTASRTQAPKSVMPVLSPLSNANSCTRKLHDNLPPLCNWRKFAIDDYWYYVKDKWTGMIINTISRLWVSGTKAIDLKRPSYHISFCPNADTQNICHLVEAPTLGKAKKLAEWYYAEWLKVNHNNRGSSNDS